MGHTEINNKYDTKSNFFDILQIRQSNPFAWRDILNKNKLVQTHCLLMIKCIRLLH